VSPRTLRVRAPAKLTLTLRVRGRRPDGYHELAALVVSLSDPADELEVEPTSGPPRIDVDGPAATGVPTDGTNLALAAAALAGRSCHIRIHKEIPPGGGLGGGSADAAAVLRALGVSDPATAARLGSDVPVCLQGGPAWVRGRGEALEPVALPPLPPVVVLHPGFGLPTAAVYRAWDDLGGPHGAAVPAPAALAGVTGELVNDLEPAARHLDPRLMRIAEAAPRPGSGRWLLAGSGTCLWAFADDLPAARRCRDDLTGRPGHRAWVGTILPGGWARAAVLSDPADDAASGSA
jgi:4-diphosphocytidyl-2-C-methyl-D-erythritol kinase